MYVWYCVVPFDLDLDLERAVTLVTFFLKFYVLFLIVFYWCAFFDFDLVDWFLNFLMYFPDKPLTYSYSIDDGEFLSVNMYLNVDKLSLNEWVVT